ncbi:unnamed protein product [Lasius platythorax]|uniref:Integrase catalytic domain-containing protein n=1 Tax=Lasius platythorax TaxID=488582 RepID=A0AAV2MXL7_9HYME
MRSVARKFKIKHFKITAYRPQANGSVERSHHVLWEYLKLYVYKNNDWDKYLKLTSFSCNTSVHEDTRFTPHKLVFGKLARTPSSDPDVTDITDESYANYLTNLFNKIANTQGIARENLIAAKQRSKMYYDRKVNVHRFKIGNNVYHLKEPNKRKLCNQYIGPYKIVEVLRNHNVKLAISKTKTKIVHEDKIKPSPHRAPTTKNPHSEDEKYNPDTRTEDRTVPRRLP